MNSDPQPQEVAALSTSPGSKPRSWLSNGIEDIRRRWLRRWDRAFDRDFSVDTDRRSHLEELSDFASKSTGERYFPVGVVLFNRILTLLKIRYQDYVFVDVGAGKGRAVLLASHRPFKEVIGVEHAPELHAILSENIRRYRSSKQRSQALTPVCMDAARFEIPDSPCILFFNNPLKNAALSAVVANIKASYIRNPRHIIVLYLNPARRNQVREILAGAGIFAMKQCRDPVVTVLSRLPLLICSTPRSAR